VKGFDDLRERIQLTRQLIDRFNAQVRGLATLAEFSHVTYVDLRGTLSVGADYRTWWANELHPTARGFERVTVRFAAVLAPLP
jgi:hypothetical protein